ncbi:hypothetical protein MRX96_011901 [Rhipicephalus microplus]
MGAIDRPTVLKQIVSATLPTSADARGPQRTCDPHHESPDLRVTPHLQAEKEQGPCLASRTSSCSPACPAAEDRPVYSCSPAGPSRELGSGTATQLLFCWSDPDGQKAKRAHKPVAQRPPLHAAAIDAILAYTKSTANGKGWDCSEKLLVPSMGTKLAELRAEEKKMRCSNKTSRFYSIMCFTSKAPEAPPGYYTTRDMSTLAAARYQMSWTKRKPQSLSPFSSRVQVAILKGTRKPLRTLLGSLHVLACLRLRVKSTIEVPQVREEEKVEVIVILRPQEWGSMPSTLSSTQSLLCGHNLLGGVTPRWIARWK